MGLQEAKPPCVSAKPKLFQPETISSLSQRSEQIIYTPPATAFPRFANALSKSAGDATPLSVRLVQTQRVDEKSINHAFFRSEDLEILHPQQHLPQGYIKTTTYTKHLPRLQGSAKRRAQGLVNFVTALAYHFCLACLQHPRNLGPTFWPSPVEPLFDIFTSMREANMLVNGSHFMSVRAFHFAHGGL